MVKKQSLLQRISRVFFAEPSPPRDPRTVQLIVHETPIGTSGTENYSGYYSEEYLDALQGTERACVFDKMRRSDPQIKMLLNAVWNPIKSAVWEIEPAEEGAEAEADAKFVEHVLFHDMDRKWSQFLHEALLVLVYGHSVFEETHKAVIDDPEFGSYTGIRSLGFRSPKTLERWNLDKETGQLVSITQMAYGDVGKVADIPAEFLLIYTLDREGDDYEGISAIRPCYGNWKRKDLFLKLNAIGIEHHAVPTAHAEVPDGKANSPELTMLKEALQKYTSHQANYLTTPQGWKVDFIKSDFDPAKVDVVIDSEDKRMTKGFLANFLELGMNGSGSFSLGSDLSDFFLGGIEHVAGMIAEGLNEKTIPNLIKRNKGERAKYPKLKVSGISDKIGEEFAKVLDSLVGKKCITPDDDLEVHLRKRIGLPKMSEKGRRDISPPQPLLPGQNPEDDPDADPNAGKQPPSSKEDAEGEEKSADGKAKLEKLYARRPDLKEKDEPAKGPDAKLSEQSIKLAERNAQKQISAARAELTEVMRKGLRPISEDLVSQLMRSSRSDTAIKAVAARGTAAYRNTLQDALASVAAQALARARTEVPSRAHVKLSEGDGSIRLSEFDNLPPDVKKKIRAQAGLLAETQAADLEKAVKFQFAHSIDSTDSEALLEKDLLDAGEKLIEGPGVQTAAGNVASLAVNSSRNAFFFEPEVLEEIESMTFVNGDPQSPICADLAGTTFAVNDPEAQRYFPPLHHNCESYLVPNLKGTRAASKEATALKPSSPDLDKHVTLSEGMALMIPQKKPELDLSDADYECQPVPMDDGTEDPCSEMHVWSKGGKPVKKMLVKYADAARERLVSSKGIPCETSS
jgi:hypothetical protein